MDFQITRVQLSKEIEWESVQECKELFVEMMRNRVGIEATVTYDAPKRVLGNSSIMFEEFKKDTRRFLDSYCIGLYSFHSGEHHFTDTGAQIYSETTFNQAVKSKGAITVLFEDHSDYARFIKERAVMFKLSVY